MKKLLSLFVILLTISCSDADDVVNPTTIQTPVDVYVTGHKNGQPCYWKNNQLILLDSDGISNITTTKLIVSNGDVYVFGKTLSTTLQTPSSFFWKNGVLTKLNIALSTDSDNALLISDMEVVNDDVYFVGYTNPMLINIFQPSLVTWKNNVKTVLSSDVGGWEDSYIKVKNNNVYVTSYLESGYYVNTTFYSKPDAVLSGFTLNNNDVYVFGGAQSAGFYYNITADVQTNVGFPADGGVYKMCFDDNNVYVSNGEDIYKNGTLSYSVPLATNNLFDFTVKKNNLYLIEGQYVNNNPKVVKINNVTAMTTASDEDYTSLFIVQN